MRWFLWLIKLVVKDIECLSIAGRYKIWQSALDVRKHWRFREKKNVTTPGSNWWRKWRLTPPKRLPSPRPLVNVFSSHFFFLRGRGEEGGEGFFFFRFILSFLRWVFTSRCLKTFDLKEYLKEFKRISQEFHNPIVVFHAGSHKRILERVSKTILQTSPLYPPPLPLT